jgi:hypothetical protein
MEEYTTQQLKIEIARRETSLVIGGHRSGNLCIQRGGGVLSLSSGASVWRIGNMGLYTLQKMVSDAILILEEETK